MFRIFFFKNEISTKGEQYLISRCFSKLHLKKKYNLHELSRSQEFSRPSIANQKILVSLARYFHSHDP